MDYWHKYWKCPFFKWDERLKVCCECGCRICFPDKFAAKSFMEQYSAGDWEKCGIAAMLIDYYERIEENEKKH